MLLSRTTYSLIDSGNGRKLERFGDVLVARPCGQAVWEPSLPETEWKKADAVFSRDRDEGWSFTRKLPEYWEVIIDGLRFEVTTTDFGHLGVFPEHGRCWHSLEEALPSSREKRKDISILNLFAYSGGATLAAARAGCQVCHLDASKKMVEWARKNADLNGLDSAPVRWIVDDVQKFLKREIRRGRTYDGIIADPPSYGRGKRQELFKIDDHMVDLLALCRQVLSPRASFVFLSCHTPGYTPLVLARLLEQTMRDWSGTVEAGEMTLGEEGGTSFVVPSGSYAQWTGSRR